MIEILVLEHYVQRGHDDVCHDNDESKVRFFLNLGITIENHGNRDVTLQSEAENGNRHKHTFRCVREPLNVIKVSLETLFDHLVNTKIHNDACHDERTHDTE